MSTEVENNGRQGLTRYGSIGLAIFVISVGLVYLIPNSFPEGTLYVVAGILILLVNILNSLKGMSYSGFDVVFAIILTFIGADKILDLELSFLPILLIVVGALSLFKHIKRPV